LLSSPAIAIAVGFLMPIIIACTLGTTLHYFNWPRDAVFGYWLVSLCSASCSASGLISLAAGTWYYIRSKES
jgi:threonine/homoserine efflux transporter RhtA